MSNRQHRPQKGEELLDDDKPVVVGQLDLEDRKNNPKDLDVDTAAIAAGMEHGGTQESHAESQAVRGSGGRKRDQNKPIDHHASGRDHSKPRR